MLCVKNEESHVTCVLTSCTDNKIRAFTIDGPRITKRFEKETGSAYVTKFIWYNKNTVLCSLSNGNFMGWDLNTQ